MKVTLNGIEYKIHFQYGTLIVTQIVMGHTGAIGIDIKQRVTTCYITVDDLVVAEGKANCSINDNFVREVGRKLSLARAIKALGDVAPTKEYRAGFWNAYLKRPRGKQ